MDKHSLRQLIMSSAAYSLSSILGPLLLLGLPAYFIDQYLETKPLVTLIAVFISFLITNVLLFKKVTKINRMMAKNFPPLISMDDDKKGNSVVKNE